MGIGYPGPDPVDWFHCTDTPSPPWGTGVLSNPWSEILAQLNPFYWNFDGLILLEAKTQSVRLFSSMEMDDVERANVT